MTTPNIVNVGTINGLTALQNVALSMTAIIANPSGSNAVYKVDSLMIANNDSAGHSVSVEVQRGANSFAIATSTPVAVGTTYDVLSKYIFLNEGDSLRISADQANKMTAVASYAVIS